MKNKKYVYVFFSFICILLYFLCVLIYGFLKGPFVSDEDKKEDIAKVEKYLNETYNEIIEVYDVSYYDCFCAHARLVDDSDIKFDIVYNVHRKQYEDDYLQNTLIFELEESIKNKLRESGYLNFQVFVSTMTGPSFELSKNLYKYYKEFKRHPTLSELKNNEKFGYVTVSFSEDIKITDDMCENIKKIIKNLYFNISNVKITHKCSGTV